MNTDSTLKNNKMKKTIICIIAVIAIIIIVLCSIYAANARKAKEIYNNFLGKEFYGTSEDDHGFSNMYNNGLLNGNSTYWLSKKTKTLYFNNDGSVYYTSSYDEVLLAYPKNKPKPKGDHNSYDGTFDSFSVHISFDGTVYLKVGLNESVVEVDENNVPQSINNYDGITLK